VAAELERQAVVIDKRMAGSYGTLASTVVESLAREGVCVSSGAANPAFQCSVQAIYSPGSLAPIQFDLNAQRKVLASFALTPQNEKRGGEFSGASVSVKVQSVFDRVEIGDPAHFPSALRQMISAVLRAFQVSDQIATDCLSAGISTTSNGTTVSCHYLPRPPTEGALAQFTMTLSRPM